MINNIVCYDDNDFDLGEYFELSWNDLQQTFAGQQEINFIPLQGLDSTEQNVKDAIAALQNNNFIFIGLSHGNKRQLLTDNDAYVNIDDIGHFAGSMYYSPACKTAKKLGVELINNGCIVAIACRKNTFATYPDFYDVYIECENHCLKEFLTKNISIQTAYESMMAYFDDKVVKLLENHGDEILVAMELMQNKDAFTILGNSQVTKSDFQVD